MTARTLRFNTSQTPPEPGELGGGVLSVQLKFIRLIGAGGMGQVWEATSEDLPGQRFAVKVVAAAHAADPSTVSRFFGEARAAGAIDDPNIVMIHGTGRTDDRRPALVMPYIEGQSLADMCDDRGPMPLDAVGKIMLQLASALRAAHGANIVHRDIKPQNVMVMERRWGRELFVILVDFGICKFHDAEMAGEIRTGTKQYIGTPGYSAPEQILGKAVNSKADIYALGVLAYRILCGRSPYIGDSNMEVMTQQCDHNASFPDPQLLRRDIPREWSDVISLCLDRDPTRRPTASEVGRWFAAGMRNGASMLTSLAPQIAAEMRTSATAATISSDVPTALVQIQALTRHRHGKSSRVASLAAAALAGVVLTAVGFEVAGSSQERPAQAERHSSTSMSQAAPAQLPTHPRSDANPTRSAPAAATPDGPGEALPPRAIATDPGQTGGSLGKPAPLAASEAGPKNAAQGTSAKPAARVVPMPTAPDAKGRLSANAAEPAGSLRAAPDAQKARGSNTANGGSLPEPVRAAKGTGSLEIRAKTWADCFLSDGGQEVSIGTAPLSVPVPVGRHRVRCENKGEHKDDTVTVIVDAAKPAVIEKNW